MRKLPWTVIRPLSGSKLTVAPASGSPVIDQRTLVVPPEPNCCGQSATSATLAAAHCANALETIAFADSSVAPAGLVSGGRPVAGLMAPTVTSLADRLRPAL